jgi:hypothetical protein
MKNTASYATNADAQPIDTGYGDGIDLDRVTQPSSVAQNTTDDDSSNGISLHGAVAATLWTRGSLPSDSRPGGAGPSPDGIVDKPALEILIPPAIGPRIGRRGPVPFRPAGQSVSGPGIRFRMPC